MHTRYDEAERSMEALAPRISKNPALLEEFNRRLDFSWIYHDSALEGVVLSYHELNAAIHESIISDASLIPSYSDIENHKKAIDLLRQTVVKSRFQVDLEYIKQIHLILNSEEAIPRPGKPPRNPGQYRKDNPLHRLYFHEIVPPEKISYRMRKLVEWLETDEARRMHPIRRASKVHFRLITIFPWPRHSGKVARLVMNALLLRDGFLPAVIHAIERQRYYDVLRIPHSGLTTLVCESVIGTIEAATRFFDEVEQRASLAVAS